VSLPSRILPPPSAGGEMPRLVGFRQHGQEPGICFPYATTEEEVDALLARYADDSFNRVDGIFDLELPLDGYDDIGRGTGIQDREQHGGGRPEYRTRTDNPRAGKTPGLESCLFTACRPVSPTDNTAP